MVQIFISYRRVDSQGVVGRIYDYLENEFGDDNVFKDVDDIPPGTDFRHAINAAVEQCDVLLVVIGRSWLDIQDQHGNRRLDSPNDFVRLEIEAGLQRDDVTTIPLIVQNSSMPSPDSLPQSLERLAYLNALKIRDDPDFRRDIGRLINYVKTFDLKKTEQNANSNQTALVGQKIASIAKFPTTVLVRLKSFFNIPKLTQFFSRKRIIVTAILLVALILFTALSQRDESPESEESEKTISDIIDETDDDIVLIYNDDSLTVYNASGETLSINEFDFALPDYSQSFDTNQFEDDELKELTPNQCIHIRLGEDEISAPIFCQTDGLPSHDIIVSGKEDTGLFWVWDSTVNEHRTFLVLYNDELVDECSVEEGVCTFSLSQIEE